MLVVTRFEDVTDVEGFLAGAERAVAAFAVRPGFVRGRVGQAVDDPGCWVLSTEWTGVGAYRRSLSSYDVKVDAAPLLAQGRDEPSAFEVRLSFEGDGRERSRTGRAADASTVGVGEASGPAEPAR